MLDDYHLTELRGEKMKRRIEELEHQVASSNTQHSQNGGILSPQHFDPSSTNQPYGNITPRCCMHRCHGECQSISPTRSAQSPGCVPQQHPHLAEPRNIPPFWPSVEAEPQLCNDLTPFLADSSNNSSMISAGSLPRHTSGFKPHGGASISESAASFNNREQRAAQSEESRPMLTFPTLRNDFERDSMMPITAGMAWPTNSTNPNVNDFHNTSPITMPTPPESIEGYSHSVSVKDFSLYNESSPKSTDLSLQCRPNRPSKPIPHVSTSPHSASVSIPATQSHSDASLDSHHPPTISKNAPLSDRIAYMTSCASAAGFDGLEDVFSSYYFSDLSSSHALSNAQRLSRNRRLPGILGELRTRMAKWTPWEAQGCKNELLRAAETISSMECEEFASSEDLQAAVQKIEEHVDAQMLADAMDPGSDSRHEAIKRVSKILQNEVPNAWALITSLSMTMSSTGSTSFSAPDQHIVLAAISLLCFSGSMSGQKLREWIGACITT